MKRKSLILLASLSLPASAYEITWTATGAVTAVSGTGFAAAVAAPVSVKFSYNSELSYHPISGIFGTWDKCEFYGDIGLVMEVVIGGSTWKGVVASSPASGTTALLVDAWRPDITPDVFTVTASSLDAGVFAPFPYTGSATDRSMQVVLRDATAPSDFLNLATLPNGSTLVSEITSGSGTVSAGSDRISFSILPASVAVITDEPRIPLSISTTATGIELRWPSAGGINYRLEECDALAGWQTYDTYPGTGADIVVPLTPFAAHPERRFYRVVTE